MVKLQLTTLASVALCLSATALAHHNPANNKRHAEYLERRQNVAPTPAVSGIPPLSAISSGMPTATPSPLFTSFAPGATPPVSGAPPLPTLNINPADYPALDVTPPTNGSHLTAWMNAVKAASIPNWPQTKDGSCASDPELIPNAGLNGSCWWTCGGCLRPTDVSTCPQQDTWGVTYDDGPSDYTPQLLNDLHDLNLHATFYAVGSRVVSRPGTVQAEYMLGHQLSVHTWSHPSLTSLTNEEIVAELGWTMIAIKNVLGVTPNTFRPPYGDIDDRVRAIAKVMGLTPSMWTSYGEAEFDTEDWEIPAGTATGTSSYAAFTNILDLASKLTTGFIVLEHDLYQQTVEMAVGYFLPLAKTRSFTLKALYECLGQTLAQNYIETAGNSTSSTPSGSNTSSGASSTSSSGTGKPTSTGTGAGTTSKATGTQSLGEGQATQSTGAGNARVSLGLSGSVLAGGMFSLVMMAAGAVVLL